MRAIKKIGKFRHRSVFQIIWVQKNCNLKKAITKMTKIRNLGKKDKNDKTIKRKIYEMT